MEVEIRLASVDDVGLVAPLFDAYRRFYGLESDLSSSETYLAARLEGKEAVILLATAERGDAIGFVQLYPTFSSLSMARAWVLYDLFVAAEARRMGVGRRLMEAAHQVAMESGAAYLRLETAADNIPAQRLYESMGYARETEFFTYYYRGGAEET